QVRPPGRASHSHSTGRTLALSAARATGPSGPAGLDAVRAFARLDGVRQAEGIDAVRCPTWADAVVSTGGAGGAGVGRRADPARVECRGGPTTMPARGVGAFAIVVPGRLRGPGRRARRQPGATGVLRVRPDGRVVSGLVVFRGGDDCGWRAGDRWGIPRLPRRIAGGRLRGGGPPSGGGSTGGRRPGAGGRGGLVRGRGRGLGGGRLVGGGGRLVGGGGRLVGGGGRGGLGGGGELAGRRRGWGLGLL